MNIRPLVEVLNEQGDVGNEAAQRLALILSDVPDAREQLIGILPGLPTEVRARCYSALYRVRVGEIALRECVRHDLAHSSDPRLLGRAIQVLGAEVSTDRGFLDTLLIHARNEHTDISIPAIQALEPVAADESVSNLLADLIQTATSPYVKTTAMRVAYSDNRIQSAASNAQVTLTVFADPQVQRDATALIDDLIRESEALLEFCHTAEQNRLVTDEILPALSELRRLLDTKHAGDIESIRNRAKRLLTTSASSAKGLVIGLANNSPKAWASYQLAEKLLGLFGDIP